LSISSPFLSESANSGIGKEIATYAAAKGAKLYMLCRSKERAEKARDDIVKLTSNDQVEIILVSQFLWKVLVPSSFFVAAAHFLECPSSG
jgi:NAD(P)-dependent dehydrogenase (short-subunit alcohol dehydrogenase family)